ncbi:MAG: AMP-binding protein, partial [Acidobacteria bacterium]|nr:AMP-binding protein [Acidobacteriota bacterium]
MSTDRRSDAGGATPAERREQLRQLLERRAGRVAAPVTREVPLSVGQQALYFLYRLAPESSSYNVVFAARIRSAVDAETLDRCWRRIVARHGSLRATFHRGGDGPVQRIGETLPALEVFGAASAAGADDAAWIDELRAYAGRPFDLGQGPVVRLGLFHRGPEDHALVLAAHHIAVDFWSFGVLLEELHALYPAVLAGETRELPPPAAEYGDFVSGQRSLLDGPRGEALASYWRQRLAQPPTLRLATDRPRGATQGFAGATHRFDLGAELAANLRLLARERGTTLFSTLLAGLFALLHRYTGQDDVVVGSPVAGRSRRELEGVVGYFANMVALRGRPRPETTFVDLVETARAATLEALEHGDYPFPLLVEALGLERDPSRSPIFDVAFAVESSKMDRHGISGLLLGDPEATSELAGWRLESLPVSQQEGQFDLTFHLLETETGVGGLLMYDTGLYDESTARRMAGHLAELLAGAVENPETPLVELSLVPAAERTQLLEEWNSTRAAWPEAMTVRDLLLAEIARRPDELALDDGVEAIGFGELHRRAARLGAELRRLGADPETPVAVCGPRTTAPVVGFVAAVLAGVPYLPLDPAYPDERLRFMIEDSGARLLVTTAAMAARFATFSVQPVLIEAAIAPGPVPAMPEPRIDPENLAYVIYTSGSTGRPK